jgi:hypothetical protein
MYKSLHQYERKSFFTDFIFKIITKLVWLLWQCFWPISGRPIFSMLFSTSNSTKKHEKTFCCNLFRVRQFFSYIDWTICSTSDQVTVDALRVFGKKSILISLDKWFLYSFFLIFRVYPVLLMRICVLRLNSLIDIAIIPYCHIVNSFWTTCFGSKRLTLLMYRYLSERYP